MEFAAQRPRVMSRVLKNLEERTCMNPTVALECQYSLTRGNKQLTGASIRFAEILANTYCNLMALKRVVAEDREVVRAQGIFFDCETNYRYGAEVSRRITDKDNHRFNRDMIVNTGNAAASIAFRNAVLGGVGKGIWSGVYEKTRQVAIGNIESVVKTRDELLAWAKAAGVTGEMLFSTLGVQGVADITGEKLLALKVMQKDVMAGDKSIDEVFGTLESANIEAAMAQLRWNEGQKTASRMAYRGKPAEHLDYLKKQIAEAEKRGVTTTAPAKKEATKESAPKPASNAPNAGEMPRAGSTVVGDGSEAQTSDGAKPEAAETRQTAAPPAKPASETRRKAFDF
jgi:hypothetical protein